MARATVERGIHHQVEGEANGANAGFSPLTDDPLDLRPAPLEAHSYRHGRGARGQRGAIQADLWLQRRDAGGESSRSLQGECPAACLPLKAIWILHPDEQLPSTVHGPSAAGQRDLCRARLEPDDLVRQWVFSRRLLAFAVLMMLSHSALLPSRKKQPALGLLRPELGRHCRTCQLDSVGHRDRLLGVRRVPFPLFSRFLSSCGGSQLLPHRLAALHCQDCAALAVGGQGAVDGERRVDVVEASPSLARSRSGHDSSRAPAPGRFWTALPFTFATVRASMKASKDANAGVKQCVV